MPNAKDTTSKSKETIFLVGDGGSGKTSQIWTLPGKKFAYLFDPNALRSLEGCDLDYEEWIPEATEIDVTIKGFNRKSISDKPPSKLEPRLYMDWIEDLLKKTNEGFWKPYDWFIIDSGTFLERCMMDRQKYINNRYGGIEELADYRIVGSKMVDLFRSITSEDINIFVTGHIQTFQDEKTKKITTELKLSGSAKSVIPIMFSQIWRTESRSTEKEDKFVIQTKPEARGLQTIRSSAHNLSMYEDVTIKSFREPEKYGIGRILSQARTRR